MEFAVAGTGIGIAKEDRATTFEKFRQRDNSETRKFAGLGLDLFIAKKFAQLMGGDIVVASESGRGSTLTVTLPISSNHGHPATDSNTRQLAAAHRTHQR